MLNEAKHNLPTSHTVVADSKFVAPQVFCDGIGGITISASVCKLDLHQVVGIEKQVEQRRVTQTVVIPTASLVEFCQILLGNITGNASKMQEAFAEQQRKVFSSVPAVQPGVSVSTGPKKS